MVMRMRVLLPVLVCVAACEPSPETTETHFGPESLLQESRETVSMPLPTVDAVKDLVVWVRQETPQDALLRCDPAAEICGLAQRALQRLRVPVRVEAPDAQGDAVVLSYLRVGATDCTAQIVDNAHNVNNLALPGIGCATSANELRMITTADQILRPGPVGPVDGAQAVKVMESYRTGPSASDANSSSLLQSASGSE